VRIPMHYRLVNKEDQGLGVAPLPHGKVRIFQDDGRGSTAFIGEDFSRFTPVGDETRLFLGVAQDVVVTRTIEKNEQTRVAGQLYHREVVIKYEIENFKTEAITLDVAEAPHRVRNEVGLRGGRDPEWILGPDTTFPAGLNRDDSTYERLVVNADVPARNDDGSAKKVVHRLHLVFRNEW